MLRKRLARHAQTQRLLCSRNTPVSCVALSFHTNMKSMIHVVRDCSLHARHAPWTAHRFCATVSSRTDATTATPVASSPQANFRTPVSSAELQGAVAKVPALRTRLVQQYVSLLLDRRALYRDHLLQDTLAPLQSELQGVFRLLSSDIGLSPRDVSPEGKPHKLAMMTGDTLQALKAAWLTVRDAPATLAPSDSTSVRTAYFAEVRAFYAAVLCSGLLTSDAEIRLTVEALQRTDLLEPDASFYESVFLSLWSICEVQRSEAGQGRTEDINALARDSNTTSTTTSAKAPAASSTLVVGEARQLRRSVVGDLASYYMGHALARRCSATTHVAVRPETWELFFCTFAHAQPAPMLMDLWWKRFLEWLDAQPGTEVPLRDACVDMDTLTSSAAEDTSVSPASPVPYQAAHAILAWCAQSRDLQRALEYFNAVNQRGVLLRAGTTPVCATLPPSLLGKLRAGARLTTLFDSATVQLLQLSLLVKLMASTKSIKMDGGLRALVVRDVQRQINPDVLYGAPWGVVNDLLTGLSVTSAMQLLRRCSLDETAPARQRDDDASKEAAAAPECKAQGKDTEPRKPQRRRRRDVPFYIWASLLRRCCHEHLQDQAETLFLFVRTKFPLTGSEKRELVEIMMRMYVTMQPSDFPSALDVFLQHVLRHPPQEPAVAPDAVLYELLIKGADSRNASMMLFLEACAAGVPLTQELFDALMGSTEFKTVASLSRKLPHDYGASSLDAQLKIPADADAHLRREEALRARNKPLYDSTGDAG